MAVNFRMSYNEGRNYVDLFPKTNIDVIDENDNALKHKSVVANINIPGGRTTFIMLNPNITKKLAESPFYAKLLTSGERAERAFAQIMQIAVEEGKIEVTGLNSIKNIDVELVFEEAKA